MLIKRDIQQEEYKRRMEVKGFLKKMIKGRDRLRNSDNFFVKNRANKCNEAYDNKTTESFKLSLNIYLINVSEIKRGNA